MFKNKFKVFRFAAILRPAVRLFHGQDCGSFIFYSFMAMIPGEGERLSPTGLLPTGLPPGEPGFDPGLIPRLPPPLCLFPPAR